MLKVIVMANLECPSVDINLLSPNGFILTISKLPNVSFFAQEVSLPGILLGEPEFSNPFSKQPIPGDTITFDPLEIQFAVDSEMSNYIAVSDWMFALGFPNDYSQYVELVGDRALGLTELTANYSDATLIILGPNNVKVKELYFKDCFPTSLSAITLTSKSTNVQYVAANLTMKFGYYKFV